MLRMIRDLIVLVLLMGVCFVGVQAAIQSSIVKEHSMEPTLYEGQRLILNKVKYVVDDPVRGEIIVFLHPHRPHSTPLIKRVIGLPGDTVEIMEGQVIVNSYAIDEPYLGEPPGYEMGEITVPENSYFVLGDNRNYSEDSHNDWTVPRENILAKAWLSIWPPDTWGLAPNTSYDIQ